jgi:outer membrane biogenesis lipoprotein LolB
MSLIKIVIVTAAIGLLASCSSPQDKAAAAQEDASKAEAKIAKQRLELINKYQACVANAAGDQQKAAACDSYLKAADALK